MQTTEPIRVAIVEDKPDIREGLAFLINSSPGFTCPITCGAAEDLLERLGKESGSEALPDVVLMDIGLPGMSGIECLRELKARFPGTQVMMLTVYDDDERIFQSLQAGASGYLLKKTSPTKLLEAVQDVRAGGSPMSNPIARRVLDAFKRLPSAACVMSCPGPNKVAERRAQEQADAALMAELSPRENEILQCLAKGFQYKEVADRLKISTETVRTHIRRIYEKLQVRSRAEAMIKVFGK